MPIEPPEADPPKRKRRWYQFSLLSLLLFTAIVATPCAWLGRRIEQKRREREAVKAIVKLGGDAWYDYQVEDVYAKPRGPDWLRGLLGDDFFSEVEGVEFGSVGQVADISSFSLVQLSENLKELPHLHSLRLRGLGVSDFGLVNLQGLAELKTMRLIDTNTTEAAIADLRKALPNCGIFVLRQYVPRTVTASKGSNFGLPVRIDPLPHVP